MTKTCLKSGRANVHLQPFDWDDSTSKIGSPLLLVVSQLDTMPPIFLATVMPYPRAEPNIININRTLKAAQCATSRPSFYKVSTCHSEKVVARPAIRTCPLRNECIV